MGIGVLWLSVTTSLLITKLDVLGTLPISYLGVFDSSKYIFNIGLILSSILLLLFSIYLYRKLNLTKLFLVIVATGQIAQVIVALTPFSSQSIARPVHVIAGFVIAFSLPLSMLAFLRSKVPNNLHKATRELFFVELILFILGIGWFVIASRAGALAEIVTAVTFDTWILYISLKLNDYSVSFVSSRSIKIL